MKTRWGEALNKDNILTEYPRPQMKRDSYLNLNGTWDYAITESEQMPDRFDGEILVPFSPECELSGVQKTLAPNQTLWYRRSLSLPESFTRGRVLLHFGAVDQTATVFVNGTQVCSHIGGYTPFGADITGSINKTGETIILVKVRDWSDTVSDSRGKQKSERGGIWYTAQSGIWQTVWAECVPDHYIQSLWITPLFDERAVELTVRAKGSHRCHAQTGGVNVSFLSNEPVKIKLKDVTPWTPENPFLYDLTVIMESTSMEDDRVTSYFGMRKFSVDTDQNGKKRLFLNNQPYFHNGLLDQGYYSDGMYTAPSDEAMIFDIQTAKNMGFNMLRKHIKVEPLRWYFHCDRLGMLVWQDMINGGGAYRPMMITSPILTGIHFKDHHYKWFAREDARGREQYYEELDEMIHHLYNTVSVAMWVPFNEGWGQFDAAEAVKRIQNIDTTRTIDHASGWHDQKIGEIKSLHVYFKKYRFHPDHLGRAVVLSEFGGYNLRVNGHCFNQKDFGYKRLTTAEALFQAYRDLYENQIIPAKRQGLSAAVYTQLTDVEDELNGLITYDRKVVKLPEERVLEINQKVNSNRMHC